MFIENCAAYEIPLGKHLNPGDNSMLIQIVDPDQQFPVPLFNFNVVKQYKFLDVDEGMNMCIKDIQAQEIANDLKFAYENKMNVVVHCMMGICRSGAVTEVGCMLGFEDTGRYRQPNITVKKMLMKHLNLLPYGIS